ncbi:mediator of RNA polymerase II transcription subunit 8 [Podospora aff. communis PSN243]|uniref:Mediator of RNA polymerase II transcription subunit 8 n=1 Tax=Podospora aff. communis PSN243 TaxID=3040156 RepID=A0AAV9GUL4_9PEZI|nr:mediator of RNA polymerase II transcription subunit 8 [Podospora aff. communis PSN243]
MASLGLAPDELNKLDLIRSRFAQLSSSLISLQRDVNYSNPLPSRESLQSSSLILLHTIASIQKITTEHSDLLQRIAVHPSTNYPGRTHEHILLHLLRKKLEPDIESLVEDARKTGRGAGVDPAKLAASGKAYPTGEDDEYRQYAEADDVPGGPFNERWKDIRDACDDGVVEYIQTQAREGYTVEEQQMGVTNVRTGLKRSLDEEESEEEEEEEDEEEDEAMGGVSSGGGKGLEAGPPGVEPEVVFWFAARGDVRLPANTKIESQKKKEDNQKRPAGR